MKFECDCKDADEVAEPPRTELAGRLSCGGVIDSGTASLEDYGHTAGYLGLMTLEVGLDSECELVNENLLESGDVVLFVED